MSDNMSEFRDMILALSDRAEELGESAAAAELRSVALDVGSGRDATARAALAWCLEARRSGAPAGFSITEGAYPGEVPPGSFGIHLWWAGYQTYETFEPGCPPHAAIDRLERAAMKARNWIEEHARRNPGTSPVLDLRQGAVTTRTIPYHALDPSRDGNGRLVRGVGPDAT